MDKVIVIDWSIFVFRSIFSWRNNKAVPPEYTCLNMLLASLRRIGLNPYDTVILACDGRGNWRKDYEKEYKATRKAFRESFTDINWENMFKKFDNLLEQLEVGTDFHQIKLDTIEADDIASVCCRYEPFKDKEIILVSYDSDWQMLMHYSNVKVFSPLLKYKSTKGSYKIKPPNFNAYKLLSKKIEKEKADDLINPILSEKDYETRKLIVNLLELPDFVEQPIREELAKLEPKTGDLDELPFQTSLRPKIEQLYDDKSKVLTYKMCQEYQIKKEARKKKRRKKK